MQFLVKLGYVTYIVECTPEETGTLFKVLSTAKEVSGYPEKVTKESVGLSIEHYKPEVNADGTT